MVDERKLQRLKENLRVLRIIAGYSASDFAKELGVTRQTINNIEQGASHMTTFYYLAIQKLFEIVVEEDCNMLLLGAWNELIEQSEGDDESREKLKTDVYACVGKVATKLGARELSMYVRREVCI